MEKYGRCDIIILLCKLTYYFGGCKSQHLAIFNFRSNSDLYYLGKGSGKYARCMLAGNQWDDATARALADSVDDEIRGEQSLD